MSHPSPLPIPPIDPEMLARAREQMRHAITSAPSTGDPHLDEMRENLAAGRVRGRDLLTDPTFRAHAAAGASELLQALEEMEPEERERLLGRPAGDNGET